VTLSKEEREALESVIARLASLSSDKQISFVRDKLDEGRVSVDPFMLDMILENIFPNAIKFFRPPGLPSTSLSRGNRGCWCVRLPIIAPVSPKTNSSAFLLLRPQ
jgi:signal transduction histidine kinase